MSETLNVLLIEDNDQHAKVVARHLSRTHHLNLVRKSRLDAGLDFIAQDGIDVILLDLRLPDSDYDNSLKTMISSFPTIPIVILSSLEDREFAQKLVKEGAQDFLCKSQLSEDILLRAINHARERKQIEEALKEESIRKKCLFNISELGLTQNSLPVFLKNASEMVVKAMNAHSAIILRYSKTTNEFSIRGGYGPFVENVSNINIRSIDLLSSDFSTKISSHKPTIYLTAPTVCKTDRQMNIVKNALITQPKAGIGASIYGSNGCGPDGIFVIYTEHERIFSKEEKFFVKALANIFAAAIKRHNLEFALKQRVKDLNEAHRRKDEFLSVLSHELRTPLSVITGYADLLDNLSPDSKEFKKAVNLIKKNAEAELHLVEDVLDISRIITGRLKCQMAYVSIKSLVQSAIETVSLAARSKKIEIIIDMDDTVRSIIGDEDRLRQVIWNLLTNAIKFTKQNGTIKIFSQRIDDQISLEIVDTGCGLSQEDTGKVFNRFWQEDMSTTRKNNGLGLGLSISKKIIELHGGSISCWSKGRGFGTTFSVLLPINTSILAPDVVANVVEEVSTIGPSKSHKQLSGQNILLVEDADDLREMFEIYFSGEGAKVTSFSSASEALAEIKKDSTQFSIIVSDIGLPDFDGYELIEKICSDIEGGKDIPSVALTAYASSDDTEKAMKAGFDIHIAKPVKKDDLIAAVLELLSLKN